MPKGGPDGGDGGRGGDVVVLCDDSLRDLQAFRRRAHFRAGRGGHGQGALRHGADGEALDRPGPAGHAGRALGRHPLRPRAAGPAGDARPRRRRAARATSASRPPSARRRGWPSAGCPARRALVELQLKLLADVGLVGLPNAGKSSLLARLTRARPKVAGYPFTTLEPVLGTLESEERQLVIADIPGLIEGASAGAGLGHDFLAHVERTALLVHVLDLAPLDGSDPAANHAVIERELAEHDERLAGLPRILALSKADLVPPEKADDAAREWRGRLGREVPVIVTSSATGEGLDELARELLRRVPVAEPEPEERRRGRRGRVPRVPPGGAARRSRSSGSATRAFRVSGESVDRLIARHDLENEEALAHIEHRLRRMGVIAALEAEGFEPGDDVEIGGVVFELDPALTRRRGARAPRPLITLPAAMPALVVKLGSSIVAEDSGELRLSVVARICEEVADLHRAGVDVVIVTSGAIARGMHLLQMPLRPNAIEELQAASAVGQGRLYRTYDELLRELRRPDRPGAAHVLRHERPHALSQRPPHAADAAALADRAGHQRERHDDDRRDLLRRQRLPGRAGRRADRGAAC